MAVVSIIVGTIFAFSLDDNNRKVRTFLVLAFGFFAAVSTFNGTYQQGHLGDPRLGSYETTYTFVGQVGLGNLSQDSLALLKNNKNDNFVQYRFFSMTTLKPGEKCCLLKTTNGKVYLQKID
jgi:hypothetical protein